MHMLMNKKRRDFHARFLRYAVTLFCGAIVVSCGTQPTDSNAFVKRYTVTGRIVSIDKAGRNLNVDADEIPGFMSAMEMPYAVKDPKYLDLASPGDKIKAELVVSGDGEYLENIVVTAKASGVPPPKQK
jgi:protein SCO1/2